MVNMTRLQMTEIKDSDVNAVISLQNHYYSPKRTSKQWIWEYKSNYPDLFVFTIIKHANRVVGTQGMIPIYINIKGRVYLSGKSENSLLDLKYRGRGLFTELYDFALSLCKAKKMCCVWGLTGEKSAIKVLRKLGFSIYENVMHNSVLILSPRKFISSQILKSRHGVARKIAESLLVMFLFLYSSARRFSYRYLKRTTKTPREFSIEQKVRSVSDLGRLYERLRQNYADLIHIEQDEKYVTWRIFNNPNIEYTTYFVYEDNLLRAYCYVSSKKNAYLSDLTFEDYDAGDFLLRTVLNLLCERKSNMVGFMGNVKNPLAADIFNLLKKHGFVKIRESAFVLRNMSHEHEQCLYDIKNWYLNGLCTEGYEM